MSDALDHTRADRLCAEGLHAFVGGVCRDCGHVAQPPVTPEPRRRGPAEALAMEIYNVGNGEFKNSAVTFDRLAMLAPEQHAGMMRVAEYVLANFTRKNHERR